METIKFQCYICKKEIDFFDLRVELPESNLVCCIICFYNNYEIIY